MWAMMCWLPQPGPDPLHVTSSASSQKVCRSTSASTLSAPPLCSSCRPWRNYCLCRSDSRSVGPASTVKLKRMFLEGRTPEEIRDTESRLQEHAVSKAQRQDAVLHHDFDKMRREVESLGELLGGSLALLGPLGCCRFQGMTSSSGKHPSVLCLGFAQTCMRVCL